MRRAWRSAGVEAGVTGDGAAGAGRWRIGATNGNGGVETQMGFRP